MVVVTNAYSKDSVLPWDWYSNNSSFAKEYDKIMKNHPVKKVWLRKLKGVGSPVKKISLDGIQYDYVHSCKPHDCANNQIHVLYNTKKKQIFALYGLDEKGNFLSNKYSESIKKKLIELSGLKTNTKIKNSNSIIGKWKNKNRTLEFLEGGFIVGVDLGKKFTSEYKLRGENIFSFKFMIFTGVCKYEIDNNYLIFSSEYDCAWKNNKLLRVD